MLRNEKGFALAVITAVLPLVVAGFLLVWGGVGLIQQDLALKYACRQQGLSGQKKVAPLLEKLLSLNPKAAQLRRDLIQTRKALSQAKHPAVIAALTAKLALIEARRAALDLQQRGLVQESNRALTFAHRKGHQEVLRNARLTSNIFLKLHLDRISGQPPELAVRPDYSDIAPTYSPTNDFSRRQALAHDWQYVVTVQEPMARFLPGKFTFKKACAVTLKKELLQWTPQITTAKFSLKSVW